jgi:hypothetical protein
LKCAHFSPFMTHADDNFAYWWQCRGKLEGKRRLQGFLSHLSFLINSGSNLQRTAVAYLCVTLSNSETPHLMTDNV